MLSPHYLTPFSTLQPKHVTKISKNMSKCCGSLVLTIAQLNAVLAFPHFNFERLPFKRTEIKLLSVIYYFC
jgi:hypothetical protein